MLSEGSRSLVVIDDGRPAGVLTLDRLSELLDVTAETAAQPVIPEFDEASSCVTENRLFCPDWVRENWARSCSRRSSSTSSSC